MHKVHNCATDMQAHSKFLNISILQFLIIISGSSFSNHFFIFDSKDHACPDRSIIGQTDRKRLTLLSIVKISRPDATTALAVKCIVY